MASLRLSGSNKSDALSAMAVCFFMTQSLLGAETASSSVAESPILSNRLFNFVLVMTPFYAESSRRSRLIGLLRCILIIV